MISEVITIDGQEVKVRVSASLPRLYRAKFQRDLFVDLKRLQKVKDSNEDLTDLDCEIFENIASKVGNYVFAQGIAILI